MNKFYINLNKLLRSGDGVAKIRIDTTESTTTTAAPTTTTVAPGGEYFSPSNIDFVP